MLSVIVPIYNVEQYLPRCIESILNQKYESLEIILVDDGSTDRCPQICDQYAQIDRRIQVIHTKNKGLVKARKTGLERASGKFICFVDDDDWIDSRMYLELIDALKESEADFVDSGFFYDMCGDYVIEERRKGTYGLDSFCKHKIFSSLIGIDDFIKITPSIWSKVFKAEIIKNAYRKVPDTMWYGEDVISLIYCILKSDKMIQVEEQYYYYNYREDSMSHYKSVSYIRKELMLWNYCGDLIMDNDRFMTQRDIDECIFRKLYFALRYLNIYVFPCLDILHNKKVVLYGAGKVGKDYLAQIERYKECELVYWVDKKYENIDSKNIKVTGTDSFLNKAYDIVLIAVAKKEIAEEIRETLLMKGVPNEKIVWYEPKLLVS